ncbi:hypothetical protein [Phenylobacterium montanum]|uniref:Uncharacterized protein n=1 Tax=Phenylobacterium montanum TaxID=2823693 RepID=A0A975FXX9_9CAUL|nr:hypothetical protein [Caulobacter sp. S6]QUD86336.1 hypothetical protein KCG34_14645 [Caulobacter sp. S6]
MTNAQDGHRAYVVLGIGAVCIILAAFQLWRGAAFVGFGWKSLPTWASRSENPGLFWGQVGPVALLGLFSVCLGVKMILSGG